MLILLVEDNAITGLALADALTMHGHRVLGPFPTEAKAMRAMELERPDVAALDIRLRGGTSIGVARALGEAEIPFCFLTGYSDPLDLPEELSGVPRLTKPIDVRDLATLLESLV